jgi:AmmeMemoRadiSam system protein A
MLDDVTREGLLQRARAAIERAIGAPITRVSDVALSTDVVAGAFVTLRADGVLRGCIGYPEADLPLLEVVERCAVSAATRDPRFAPVTIAEWNGVSVEISVLGPVERIAGPSAIEIGRHGVIVDGQHRRGLLLPQVAVEQRWTAADLVSQVCLKAGLPRDAWRSGAELFRFEADVFGEDEPTQER